MMGFPRLYAAASLKQRDPVVAQLDAVAGFSAALCRGLIEAIPASIATSRGTGRFPRLYAAASLKRGRGDGRARARRRFSAALCRGLIEAPRGVGRRSPHGEKFSAALCRGLIEASLAKNAAIAASSFSAALCRGLIEAASPRTPHRPRWTFSAALCRGLIEARPRRATPPASPTVFRGFMPRPH